ncbi:MAG: DUF4388 domain-containing protein [Planctomycetes bacterium]|nr:DUF4388 domain-containing protein [Planctomycetota bacterium]
MHYEDVEAHINKLCAGFVMRVREQTRSLSKWPEENSVFQKILSLVNELERNNELLNDIVRDRRHAKRGLETRTILAQAFQTAVTRVTHCQPIVDLGDGADESKPEIVFDGRVFGVKEVLRFLSESCRSGRLRIEGEREVFSIELHKGDVVSAVSNHSPEGTRLGDILVDRYGVDRRTLDDFVRQHAGAEQLGKALCREELVSNSIIQDALRFQTAQLFERLLDCEGRDLHYDPNPLPDEERDAPSINLGELLISGILA